MIQQQMHRLADRLRSIYASYSSPPGTSIFETQGKLTPEEFVKAGDQLCFKFPSWAWETCEEKKRNAWLPHQKQYLITRGVRCNKRVKDLDSGTIYAEGEGEDADWLIAQEPKAPETPDRDIGSFEDVCDEDYDPANASNYKPANKHGSEPRRYDLSITYDPYFLTPRIWLFGYRNSEDAQPLTPDEIFEDVVFMFAKNTVTVDPFPFTGILTASIHPCNHAEMMKKVISGWKERNEDIRHDLYLFVLLKFISSVIPTIEYDFTTAIDMAPSCTYN